jgi:1A family penicillin-binding protein
VKLLLYALITLLFIGSAAFAATAGIYAYYARDLPDYSGLDDRRIFQTARVFDRNGQLLDEINDPSGGRRTLLRLEEIPMTVRDATVAAEDASFYSNPGFEPRAVVRALYQNFRGQRIVSGASTITQQLAKNTMLTPEATTERKIKEALLAIELTRRYSKDKILEMYLNEIYYGNLAYGIEAAAQTYFGKTARQLDLAEASFLAGLPQAPAANDPFTNMAAAKERQAYVLSQMEENGFSSAAEARSALAAPLNLRRTDLGRPSRAPHFVVYVRQWLEQRFPTDLLYRAGLQVQTSLDLGLQETAERSAREQIQAIRERNASNSALVALRPETGEVLAMLGSLDFNDPQIDGEVNVAIRPRQPGSALKPFTYLASFTKGWTPATMIMDVPTTFGGNYSPRNYDGKFRGPVRVRAALGQSLNVPAVKTLEFVGVEDLANTVHRYGVNGLREPQRHGLSITLGGGEVTLLDLTYAYQIFASGGQQRGAPVPDANRQPGFREFDPVVVLKITDSSGKVVYEQPSNAGRAAAEPALSYLVTHILSDDDARAPTFGRNSPLQLSRPSAAKTGTTDEFRDSWIIGFTPDLLTGVWVGNNNNTPMRDVVGAQGAGRIYRSFMEAALAGTPPRPFARPPDIVEREVCALSGLLPTPDCPETVKELFAASNLPTKQDDFFKKVEICVVNGKLVNQFVPPNGRAMRSFVTFPEPYRAWAAQNGYAQPPTQRCDDIYRGVKRAEFASPAGNAPVRGSVQVIGTALMDDLRQYDLEFGEGPSPSRWTGITMGRQQGVDNALLGVWDTSRLNPGPYSLRLTLQDSLGNKHEGRTQLTVATSETPTPTTTPTRATTPTPGTPQPTQRPDATPQPGTPQPATPKPGQVPPGAVPTPTPTPVRR